MIDGSPMVTKLGSNRMPTEIEAPVMRGAPRNLKCVRNARNSPFSLLRQSF